MAIRLPIHVIDFIPPLAGFEGDFNTFRLGRTWGLRLNKGDTVLLLDKRNSEVFAKCKVTAVHIGRLADMAERYGRDNHAVKAKHWDNVMEVVQKIHGPHIATPERWATVIYLRQS